jgi:CO/xanthine dehydrogenase Mo-binding subunit
MVGEVQEEFRRKSKEELEVVEQRSGQIAGQIVESIREQLRDGIGDMQRKLADGRNQLKGISSELLESLQARLNEEHNGRRAELEQLQAAVAGESSRLYQQIEQLDGRVRKLDESVRSLESGLDQRLSQMASDTVRNTRDEIEGVADTMLKELSVRSAQTLGNQMEEAAGNMRIFHQGIVASGSDALKAKAANALQDFEHSMDELAHLVKMDPLEFRLKNLKNERLRAVFEAAAKKFGWGQAKAAGHGVGMGGGFEKAGNIATCAEVAVDRKRGEVKVVRVLSAFECGAIVNPDNLRNQIEGSNIMGLGGALFEAIEFENGRILNGRFSSYRVPRFSDVPTIETVLLDRKDLPSAGAGECPIVGLAPAIGNAIFDATGVRLRSLPMVPNGLKAG